jgi:hypothetical protein
MKTRGRCQPGKTSRMCLPPMVISLAFKFEFRPWICRFNRCWLIDFTSKDICSIRLRCLDGTTSAIWTRIRSSSSSQCLLGYSYGELRIGCSKNGLSILTYSDHRCYGILAIKRQGRSRHIPVRRSGNISRNGGRLPRACSWSDKSRVRDSCS